MATVSASHTIISSRSSFGGVSNPEPRTFRNNGTSFLSRNQHSSYHGLRSINSADILFQLRTAKPNARDAKKRGFQNARSKSSTSIICGSGMRIVFVSAECAPWSKTGGLGDVLGGLPPAMVANGHRVMTVSPRYDQYKDAWDTSVLVELKVANKLYTVRFFHCYKRGVDRVFVDHPVFLEKIWGKTGGKIYGMVAGEDFEDNQLRFNIFCQAALEAPRVLNLKDRDGFSRPYGEDVVFVYNDWHTALLPCYLKSMYKANGIYKNAKAVFCIHNVAYQGRFMFSDFETLGLPDTFKSSFDFFDGYTKPIKGRKINWMKAGILESDKVLTVSPYYASELVSGADKGVELNDVLLKTGITGIVNGMDIQEWDPRIDKYLPVNYDVMTAMDAKPLIKEALQAELGLPIDRTIPLIGFIGRLEEQKGSDILMEAIPEFINEYVQLVVLGTGKKIMEKQLEQLEKKYQNNARGVASFNVPLAHMINSGADFMLIPSRFEPCGLIQLQAMKCGTIPIAATTGGLPDTIKDGVTGFLMGGFNVDCEVVDPVDVGAVGKAVRRALSIHGTPALNEMIEKCMVQDFSWKGPAKKWEEVLLNLDVSGSEAGIYGEEASPLTTKDVATP